MRTIPATRSSLLAGQARLARLTKGAELLRRKREALVAELFRLARPAADARAHIAAQAGRAYPSLLRALATHGRPGLLAMGRPARELTVEIRPAQIWGIPTAEIEDRPPIRRTFGARGTAPGTAGPAAVRTAAEFESLVELLLDAAPRELLLQRLGVALAKTSRQVNTLTHLVAPGLRKELGEVRRTLEDQEREEHGRLAWLKRAPARAR